MSLRSITGLMTPILIFAMIILPRNAYGQEIPPGADRWNRAALEWMGLLQNGEFEEAGARIDSAVPPGSLGPEQLKTIWGQLTSQLGTLNALLAGPVLEQGQYRIVRLPAEFENQSLVIQVTLTESLQISGFFLQPPEPPPYEAPAYVDEGNFHEVEVTVGADPWSLPGTLSIPKGDGPFPAVVLVHGSGPNDRDESIGGSRPFRDLAWGLASFGVAVLRFDKRTRVHGPKIPSEIGLEDEVVADALSALDLVRSRPEVDPGRVVLLGHSLGGIMAPEIGRRDGALLGIAILAGPVRPFFEVLTSQLEYIASLQADPDSRAQLDSLISTVKRVERGEVPDEEVVLGAPPAYWHEVAAVDPVAVAGGLSIPLFVLQGGRDYQSTTEDLNLWVQALGEKDNFSSKLYSDLNHLFFHGQGMATPEEYVTGPGHVAEEVILDLVRWIEREGGS